MSDRRALLTDREREIVAGEADVSDSYRYQTISRVRARFGRLEADLGALEEHGDLASELRAIVCDIDSASERAETTVEATAGPDTAPAPAPGERQDTAEDADTGDADAFTALVDDVATETLPGSGEKLADRREAFQAVVEYLREHGEATPSEFKSEVYPDHPAFYTSGGNPPHSWWNNAMYPALRALADRTDRVMKADTSGKWTYLESGDA